VLQSGKKLGDWVLQKRIGEGSMGDVWLAHSTMSERLRAAVKVLKPNPFDAPRERFVREIEALAKLQHQAIVRVLGWGEDEDSDMLFLAMEWLEGDNLAVRLARRPLTARVAVEAFALIAEGLQHAHDQGLSHRDIKPANLMLTNEGAPKILDFGIALDDDHSRLTNVGSITGTGPYLPPEAFTDENYQPRLGDVYATGVVLCEALTGKRAFRTDPKLSGRHKVVALMELKEAAPLDPGEEFSGQLRAVVRDATHPNPKLRFTTAKQLAQALRKVDIGADPHDVPPPTELPSSMMPMIAVGIGGALVAFGLLVAAVLFLQ